ncbi:MAG: hypothetical protein IKL47_12465 [Clostridia bacterium]|nr:hypothetical protein [Clostridia bacterium]
MRKITALIIAILMIFSLSACSESPENPDVQENIMQEESSDKEEISEAVSVLEMTADTLMNIAGEPQYGSVAGDWITFGLARMDKESNSDWFEEYYEKAETYVADCGGVLDSRKYTEYSRTVIVLTAIGKDPTNIGGYNLLAPLADFEQTIFQGMNGPVYALLALDSGNYEIPENTFGTTQATRELYVDYILGNQNSNGGWGLSGGEGEIDITAMVLQALAKYREREDVSAAIDRALIFLSENQNENGGFGGIEGEGSESVSQTIVALCELGIPIDDERFVKNGRTLEGRLLDFMVEGEGFRHLLEEEPNIIATEQAFYALIALDRAEKGMPSLYSILE